MSAQTEPYSRLVDILDRLLNAATLKAVLVLEKNGKYVASHGDKASMEAVAETHFQNGINLQHVFRDRFGSTVLSGSTGSAVRFEALAGGRAILALVSEDPLAADRMRDVIDSAKVELEALFAELTKKAAASR